MPEELVGDIQRADYILPLIIEFSIKRNKGVQTVSQAREETKGPKVKVQYISGMSLIEDTIKLEEEDFIF